MPSVLLLGGGERSTLWACTTFHSEEIQCMEVVKRSRLEEEIDCALFQCTICLVFDFLKVWRCEQEEELIRGGEKVWCDRIAEKKGRPD